jgi:hypothetical protein
MEMTNQNGPSSPRNHGAQLIAAPSIQEGVGNALRSVFSKTAPALPDDMRRLLAQLD